MTASPAVRPRIDEPTVLHDAMLLALIDGDASRFACLGVQQSLRVASANIPLCHCGCRRGWNKHVEMRAA